MLIMLRPTQIFRLIHINVVLVRHGLDELILATHLLRPVRFMMYLAPWYWMRDRSLSRGLRIRRTLEDLGPIFVKFGQILSTRRDLLPDDIAEELIRLQDQVPPFDSIQAQQIIERSFGKPVSELFASFDTQPLASASIAQVHAATMHDGREVVVKVLRPGLEPVIERDLDLLYTVAGLAERFWQDGKRLHPVEVVAEFDKVIHDELDLVREAANSTQLRRNFEGSDLLYVPKIDWDYAQKDALVMERISGIPIGDIDKLLDAGVNMKRLAENGVEIFYTQVFKHNFFHADMHPGNIFVADDGRYIAVDFGIMGSLTEADKRYLAENFVAFFNSDYQRVAELHVESGWIPADTRVDEFESAIRAVCEPNFNRPLKDISFGQVLLRLFQTARRFNMEVQPQLALLQKTLLNVEGLGRQLYPDLDLWSTAKPFLENWMRDQVGPRAFLRQIRNNIPVWSEKMPELPGLLHRFLTENTSRFSQGTDDQKAIDKLRLELRRAQHLTRLAIIGSALLISAFIILALDNYAPAMVYGAPLTSWILGGLGVSVLLSALFDKGD